MQGSGWKWGEEAAGDERAWLRGRLRTGNGCGELRRRLRTAWGVAGWGGEKKPLVMSELGCADGCRREMKWVRRTARTAADGVGAREWLEMGGEKKPLEICELGCADGCGRQMGGENCADGCGRRGCQGVAGNGWGEEAAGDQRAWLRTAADGCGRPGCSGVAGNGWGEEATGDERAWLHARLQMGNGFGELRGRLRTAWVQRSGWKWVGRRSRWRSASLAARTAADGKWVDIELRGRLRTARVPGSGWKWVGRRSRWRSASLAARTAADSKWVWRIARTAADGVGAREWLEMGGEKKPLEIRAWLRGRLRTANGWI